MRHFLLIAVAFLLFSRADGSGVVPLAGIDRPEDSVYDPGNIIPPEVKIPLIREINSVKQSSGLDMMVVVIEKPPEWEAQKFADALADRWGYYGGRALVLWILEDPNNPWISIGGLIRTELPAEQVQSIIKQAKTRANTSPIPSEAIRRAVVSLGEDLRFIGAKAARGMQAAPSKDSQKAPSAAKIIFYLFVRFRWILLLMLAGFIALIFATYTLYRLGRKMLLSLSPRVFPQVSCKRRFGAPHGGIVYTYPPQNRSQP